MSKTSIIVGSKNPAKISAVHKALAHLEQEKVLVNLSSSIVAGQAVPSGVSDQPRDDEETIAGALHRCRQLHHQYPHSFCIGLEGGVQTTSQGMYVTNWGAMIDGQGHEYIAGGARIPLPAEVVEGINKGIELGELMNDYAQQTMVKHKEGAIGILCHGLLNRSQIFAQVVILLFGQFFHHHATRSKA